MLSELEGDAITEVFRIGADRAALLLADRVQIPVTLSVSNAAMGPEGLCFKIRSGFDRSQVGVEGPLVGQLQGRVGIYLPASSVAELPRSVLGRYSALETLTDLEEELLVEISAVLLDSFLEALMQSLGEEVALGGASMSYGYAREDEHPLHFQLRLSFGGRPVMGQIVVFWQKGAALRLKRALGLYLSCFVHMLSSAEPAITGP